MSKSRTVGVTHVALEVGDIDVALAFYGEFLSFQLRGQIDEAMFVDRSDQLLVFVEVHCQEGDESRHLGLIVEDKANECSRCPEHRKSDLCQYYLMII